MSREAIGKGLSPPVSPMDHALQEYRNVPVKFVGQVQVPSTMDTGKDNVAEYLLERAHKKELRQGFEKALLLTLSPVSGIITAAPAKGGKAITISLHSITGLAVIGPKFAIIEEGPEGSSNVYGFTFKRKQDATGFLTALENAKSSIPDVMTQVMSTPAGRKLSYLSTRGSAKDGVLPVRLSAQAMGLVSEGSEGAQTLAEATERIKELEKQLADEKAASSAAEVARLSAVLRWVASEKDCAEMRTEMAEMRAELAGVAAEMAADMAQMKADLADERHEALITEMRAMKRGLEVLDRRLAHRVQPPSSENGKAGGLWEEVEKSFPAQEGDADRSVRSAQAANQSSTDKEKLLYTLVKRASQISEPALGKSVERSASVRDMVVATLESDIKLAEASREDLIVIIKTLKADKLELLGAAGVNAKLRAEVDEAIKRNEQLVKEIQTLEQQRQAEREQLEREKQILANTIAGQAPNITITAVPSSPNLNLNDKDDSPPAKVKTAVKGVNRDESFDNVLAGAGAQPEGDGELMEVIEDIEFVKGPTGLGFSIAGGLDDQVEPGDSAIYVTSIIQGAAAHLDGRLRVCDRILMVNNVSLENVTHDEAVKALVNVKDHVTMRVSRLLPPSNGEEVLNIELTKGSTGLGFSIAGGVDHPVEEGDNAIYITAVIEGGAAHKDGRLKIGDRLIEVNGVSMEGRTHDDAVAALQKAGNVVSLVIARLPESFVADSELNRKSAISLEEEIVVISFNKTPQGLGFSIAGGLDHPVAPGDSSLYVTHVIQGGAAEKDGRLQVGDRLVEVNGRSVLNVTHEQALEALKLTVEKVVLIVSRLPAPAEEQIDIAFEKGPGGLGFSIAGGVDDLGDDFDPGIYVVQIIAEGSADRDGRLRKGDKIIMVNGVSVERVSHDEAVRLLQQDPRRVSLRISRLVDPKPEGAAQQPAQPAPAPEASQEIFIDITLTKEEGAGFGFSIAGGNDDRVEEGDTGIYITGIIPDSVSARDGRLLFGDRLAMVNGIPLDNVSHDYAVKILQSAGKVVNFRIGRIPTAEGTADGERVLTIEFQRGPTGLGFSIAGGSDDPVEAGDNAIYVTNVIEGGAAALDGRLQLGDKLLVVNDHSVLNVTHEEAVKILQMNTTGVKLVVSRLDASDNMDESKA